MSDDEQYSYEPVFRSGRWMIEATDADGETHFMTCGVNPTEAEVMTRIRFLHLDDDKCDAAYGAERKYQS
jgi:hypothetical protein